MKINTSNHTVLYTKLAIIKGKDTDFEETVRSLSQAEPDLPYSTLAQCQGSRVLEDPRLSYQIAKLFV